MYQLNDLNDLNRILDNKHLLKHEFYQAWAAGELDIDYLKTYAEQYFHHEDALPRCISATLANCNDSKARQVLLENLNDEVMGDENHPELWLRFAEGIGSTREDVRNAKLLPETEQLINTFINLAKSSYAEGIGALYAYERQVPEVAASKIDGLERFYGIKDPETLKFFQVHLSADVHHSNATRDLFEQLPEADKAKAGIAAEQIADALWNFLSGIQQVTMGECASENYAA